MLINNRRGDAVHRPRRWLIVGYWTILPQRSRMATIVVERDHPGEPPGTDAGDAPHRPCDRWAIP